MVSQRENHIATHMWIRLGIYQSNMHVDTLGHLLATCVWIPFDIPKSNMHVDTLGHLKATCMWIPLDISKATRMRIQLDILKHHACGYAWTFLRLHASKVTGLALRRAKQASLRVQREFTRITQASLRVQRKSTRLTQASKCLERGAHRAPGRPPYRRST